ncbi:hypothetical protein [Streptomyces sp. NPDC057702]|uniref:hypothetical protein n=1 Tax=unclassified Streptomyces TaxID=2593676 RepID=UPI00368603F5
MDVSPGRHWLNRPLLALLGLAALAVGGWVAMTGLDARDRLPFALPSWWPRWHPRTELVDWLDSTGLRERDWWPAAVLGCLTLGLLLLACWLLTQAGPREPRHLPLTSPAPHTTGDARLTAPAPSRSVLRTAALSRVMAAQVAGLPGVRRARVRLSGGPRRPRARMTVVLDAGADPRAVLAAVCGGPLAQARHSADLPHLRSGLRLRGANPSPRRIR